MWNDFLWVLGGVVVVLVKCIVDGWIRDEKFRLNRDSPSGRFDEYVVAGKHYRVRSPSRCRIRHSDIVRQIRIFDGMKGYVAPGILDARRSAYWEFLRRNTDK